jgi:hypothetical protein
MLQVRKFATTAWTLVALLLSVSTSHSLVCSPCEGGPPSFTLSLLNVSPINDISDGVLVGYTETSQYTTGGFSFPGGSSTSVTNSFLYPGPYSAYRFFLVGISGQSSSNTLALFTSTNFANYALTDPTVSTTPFSTFFGVNPASLISDLQNGGGSSLTAFIGAAISDNIGFSVPGQFGVLAWDQPGAGGSGGSANANTPLPSTWTMMLIGLIGVGFFAYRRQKQGPALVTA